ENINDPSTNPNLRQPFSLGANLPSVLHVTIPDVPAGFPPGFKLDPASVTDAGPEFNIVVANGNWTVEFDPSRAAVQIGTSNAFRTFRYLLTGDFIAGEVTVNFAADQWTDSGGIKNRAFTQTFTVQGTRGDLVKRTMVPVLDANGNPTGTQTEVITSLNGRTIGKQTINGLGYLEVAFQASGGNHLDPTSINGDE